MLSLRVIIWPHLPLQLCHLTWAKTAQVYSILFLIIIMHLPCLSVKSSKPLKINTIDVNDYIPPKWVRFRTCQVASRHCLSLFIKNISDEEVRGKGEVGFSYGRRVMCNVTTESWGKARGIKDGSGHFGRSLKSFVLDQGIGQSQISAMQTVHASLRRRDSFVFQKLYC